MAGGFLQCESEKSSSPGGGKEGLIPAILLVIPGEMKAVVSHWAKAARNRNAMIDASG